MFKMAAAVSFQCLLLAVAQLLLKMAVKQFGAFSWTWHYFRSVCFNLELLLSGVCAVSGTLLWIYILRRYDFSLAYPLTSFSYVFGMLAAQWFLHEQIPVTRWIGVAIIIIGVFFVVK